MTNGKLYKGRSGPENPEAGNAEQSSKEAIHGKECVEHQFYERRQVPWTHEQLFSPETLQSLATEIVRRMPAHICSLSTSQQEYVRNAEKRSVLLANTVGAIVIAAGVTFILAMIGLGLKLWIKVK